MSCDCLLNVATIQLRPPPDPSLIWHLISDEKFEKPADCDWGPLVSITDVTSGALPSNALIGIALAALVCLLVLIICLCYKIRRRRSRRSSKTKNSTSSDAIITSGDNVWTYNSMKHSNHGSMGVLMYGNGSNFGSRVLNHATPVTLRSYIGSVPREHAPTLAHSQSTTLRLHPHENSAAYHTVGPSDAVRRSNVGSSNGEYYEEIPAIGTLPTSVHIVPLCNTMGRMSSRKPPPSCRPPPPPREFAVSPPGSDSGTDNELTRIPSESPPGQRWDEGEGRESGYGTAPSRQWRSPPGGGTAPNNRIEDASNYVLTKAVNAHSMTYV